MSPDITKCLLSSQFFVSHVLVDVSNFYTNHLLDSRGTLLSAVYLQESPDSKYPSLDPSKDLPLKLFLYTGAKFGFCDAGSLACLSKTLLTKIYHKNYPECEHKIPSDQLDEIKATLKDSYIDDLFIRSTLKYIQNERLNPTLPPDPDFEFSQLHIQ